MTKERQEQFDKVYMQMAYDFASLSYAQRRKVGAILVNKEGSIIAQGFNGTPSGFDNCCEEYDENHTLVTKKEVLHAETNAIMKCVKSGCSTQDATLYITCEPCIDCAKIILQAGIKRVVFCENYRISDGQELLRKGNIEIKQIKL